MKRTPQEEQTRQFQIISAQLNPMGAIVRLTLWITVPIFALCVLVRLFMAIGSFFSH